MLRRWLNRVRWATCLWRHPDTPWYSKGLIIVAGLYAIWPFDLITDLAPLIGWTDDLAVVTGLSMLAWKLVPDSVRQACQARLSHPHMPHDVQHDAHDDSTASSQN